MNRADFAQHEQAVDELLRLLDTSGLAPGSLFPTVKTLSLRLDIPQAAAAGAVEELVCRGLLRQQGHDIVVSPRRTHRSTRQMNSLTDAMGAKGLPVTSRVVLKDFCEATKEAAAALSLPLGARIFRLVRVRMVAGEPLLLEYSYLPAARFPGVEQYDYNTESLYRVLEQQYNTIPKSQDLEFELELPSQEEQKLLHLSPQELLLTQLGYTRDQNEHPMEYSISKSVGNRFVYESVAELGGSSMVTSTPAKAGKKQVKSNV